MRLLFAGLGACVLAACASVPPASGSALAQSVAADDSARSAEIARALEEISTYARTALLTEEGSGRADYDLVASEWNDYEIHWHTGQLIWGLVEAGKVLGDPAILADARRAGDWWVSTEFQAPHPLAGLVNAAHGDRLGPLINWTTVSDGTPGLFALTRATGDPVYADTATRSGDWLWDNTRVPDSVPGGEWLFYNIIHPETGIVFTDWDVHKQGAERDPEVSARSPAPINRVARPNIEGFLFEDMCRHTGDQIWCERFAAQAANTLSRQHPNGLWMDFEPNEPDGSQIHPRFNIWNAEALLQAYEITGDRKFLEGAARTARWHRDAGHRDGTHFYRTRADGRYERDAVTGSSVAFNGILMLRLKHYGYAEFDSAIETAATWIVKNRFANDHPDPNLAGAVINTRYRPKDGRTRYLQRDVGSTFAMRFLALYLRDLRGEDVNAYLNPETG